MNEPLVTVNILSFNRKDDLRITLEKVFEQDYKNIEVIVVDNASTDGTIEMIKTDFALVRLIMLKINIGITGWNEGFKAAKGDFVLVLDDDSYPLSGTILQGIEQFRIDKASGIVAFSIYNKRIMKYETEGFSVNPLLFVGCGALIKREVLTTVGLFNENYFIYNHELDYSAQCYNKGYKIHYHPDATVIHNQSMKSRGVSTNDPFRSDYRFYHHFLSYTVFLAQNFSFYYFLKTYGKLIVNRFIVCFIFGYYKSFFKGLAITLSLISNYRKTKRILNPDIQKFYNYGNIPLFDRDFFPSFK